MSTAFVHAAFIQRPDPLGVLMQRTSCATAPAAPAAHAARAAVPEQRTTQHTPPRPRMRPEVRDAFYRLAEWSEHARKWDFTYRPDEVAAFQARHRADPDTVIAASSPELLAEQLDHYRRPSDVRPYVAAHERRQADAERALLDAMMRDTEGALL